MKYKVGDRVRVQSLDWYKKNKNNRNEITFENNPHWRFVANQSDYCGKIATIISVSKTAYRFENIPWNWTDEMIECKVEESKPNIIEEAKTYWDSIKDAWICPDGYQFKDENGNVINATKIVLEKKKKKYPKTYEECLEVLGFDITRKVKDAPIFDYDDDIIALQRLKRCRDAYWKIAGEEMGLGKPWEPDWNDGEWKWCISYSCNCVEFDQYKSKHHTLAFPTPEMLDAFYEYFKEEIEICKEFL